MKKSKILFLLLLISPGFVILPGCSSNREPGRTYMPDMQYSRAYQAYAPNNLKQDGVNYKNWPVEGTIRRGDLFPYTLPNDSTGYRLSAQVKNPLPPLTPAQAKEAERLFNINCAICHGEKMDAQGPLSAGGKVPAVANLTLKQYVDMPEGTMFHSVTYGKGNMGSYAPQLTREERWMIVSYVKSKQLAEAGAAAPAAATSGTSTGTK
ncbi:MAG: c-type cytochrome [Chitinophagaceae bacterium]|nr:c-type cytochrome [Chitinophagaceae bacterium]